jgi:nicotinate-nucleotide adenylyltransferase
MSSAAPARRGPDFVRPPGPLANGLRIGLLGGSFNPAHEGHVHASELAAKRLKLDFVWWLVSPQNPLKPERGMAEFAHRLAAAKIQARHPRILVTGVENALGTRFTLDTVRALKRRFPSIRFVWLMGSDNLMQIPRWRRWREIFRELPIAVVARPRSALPARVSKAATTFKNAAVPADFRVPLAAPPVWTILDAKRSPASATALRAGSISRQ